MHSQITTLKDKRYHTYLLTLQPHHRGLNLFNLYVLSQSSGQSTIHLLCDFDEKLFQMTHKPELIAEDDRLEELDAETKKRCKGHGKDKG